MRIAHTGVTQFTPENSLEALKKTAELGFEGIELDIQLSGDGEIIVIHNNNMVSKQTFPMLTPNGGWILSAEQIPLYLNKYSREQAEFSRFVPSFCFIFQVRYNFCQ